MGNVNVHKSLVLPILIQIFNCSPKSLSKTNYFTTKLENVLQIEITEKVWETIYSISF